MSVLTAQQKVYLNMSLNALKLGSVKIKLIGRIYDGAATMAGELNGLQAKVRAKHESAIFVHCCAHVLNLVLSQACFAQKECKIFFSTINGLGTFFTKSSKRTNAFDNIVKKSFSCSFIYYNYVRYIV